MLDLLCGHLQLFVGRVTRTHAATAIENLYSELMRRSYLRATLLAVAVAVAAGCRAQSPENSGKPLPEVVALMREVEAHQKATEALEQNYLFHSFIIERNLDSHGNLKKSQTEDSEIFYVAGARIRRVLKKDGKDLTPDEQEKERRHIDKEIAKAKEEQSRAKNNERDQVTLSQFLTLGSFSNARRVILNGRDTIAIDFTGNPKAKPETRFQGAIREMEGTLWVDEQDRAMRKLEGHFLHDFKVGGGLLADVKQGTTFAAEWTKINGEVWLPSAFTGRGDMRVLLFVSLHGSLQATNSSYRKFKATSTVVPIAKADPSSASPP